MEANEVHGLQPKYLRHNLWNEGLSMSPATAEWSEHASPLPRPPITEYTNYSAKKTISEHPELFQVRTPINVDVFEALLKDHPNPLFVKSVCTGLREGFWPWADSLSDSFPTTHDESRPMPTDEKQATFIREQCLKEQKKGYFSESFGTDLLPGMYAIRLPHRVRSGCSQKKLADELILGVPVGLAFRWHSTVLNVTIVILLL